MPQLTNEQLLRRAADIIHEQDTELAELRKRVVGPAPTSQQLQDEPLVKHSRTSYSTGTEAPMPGAWAAGINAHRESHGAPSEDGIVADDRFARAGLAFEAEKARVRESLRTNIEAGDMPSDAAVAKALVRRMRHQGITR